MNDRPAWFPSELVDADLVERATAVRPLLESNASRCEAEGRILDENLAALEDAQLLEVMVPKRNGGHGATIATQLAVAAELARGCGSTSWVQTIFNVTTWSASLLSDEAQAEIFAGDERPRICGSVMTNGTAAPVAGGYVVSGEWAFASGCLHANWATGGALVVDGDRDAGLPLVAFMPMRALRIRDTWHVAGMRGTGSNTIVAEDVFVPDHLIGRPEVLLVAGGAGSEPSDRWPVASILALVLMGPVLGMAEAALEVVTAGAPKRGISYTSYERQIDSAVVLRNLGEAALEIDTAKLHVFRAATDVDGAGAGHELDELGRARLRGACGYANGVARSAVDRLLNIGGASSFADASPLQRIWRDLNLASRHAFLATEPSLELYGRTMFGLDSIFFLT